MNNKIIIIIAGLIVVVLAFFSGMKYAESKGPVSRGPGGTFFAQTGGGRGGIRNGMGGGFVNGEIIAKDTTSITVKMRDGSTKIVFVSNTTPVMKAASGSLSDLLIGEDVTTTGTVNPDGSVTASSVQIRPATTTPTVGQ